MKRITDFARAIIINPAGEFLLVRMASTGEWNFPGGKIEPRETPLHACMREVKEEVNLDLHNLRILYRGDIVFTDWDCMAKAFLFKAEADLTKAKIMEPSKLIDMQFMGGNAIKRLPRNIVSDAVWTIIGRNRCI